MYVKYSIWHLYFESTGDLIDILNYVNIESIALRHTTYDANKMCQFVWLHHIIK